MNRRPPLRVAFSLLLLLAGPAARSDIAPPTGNTPAAAPPTTTAPPVVITPPAGGGSPVPVPTDQPPPEVALPSPIPLGRGFLFSGALDARYRTATTGRTRQGWINAAELDLNHPLTRNGQAIGNIRLQVIAENPPDIPNAQEVQVGEAYVLYRLPIQTETDSTAYLKVGQFQLPFALLAVYDPHLLLLQPLYAQSLGLRTDFGLAISGRFYGYLNYDFSVTTGSGPDHFDLNPNRVITFRLGRTFVTRNGTVTVGGSLLQGHLPITDLDSTHPLPFELPPSGYVRADRGFTAKTRVAGDGTYNYKSLTGRGEAMIGADQDSRVLGYYAEGDYRFSPRAGVVAAHSLFEYPQRDSLSSRNAVGLTYAPDSNLTFRALYEDLYDVPSAGTGRTNHRFTVQLLLRF
ncbi:MAG: hypothetical protein JO250_00815 [Armatimonadetes bacterium]|nr:hypothetical protein [Armatimonadota bacterium]